MSKRGFFCVVSLLGLVYAATAAPQSKPAAQKAATVAPGQATGSKTGAGSLQSQSSSPSKDAALPADAPTRDQVLTLLETMQVRQTLKMTLENMQQVIKQSAEETFKEKVPKATPKQLAALHRIVDDSLITLSQNQQDELINVYVQIYQRHLTKTDIDDMNRFYSSPVGQKLLRELPQILQESMQAGAELGQRRMDEVMMKVKEHEQDLGDSETKKP